MRYEVHNIPRKTYAPNPAWAKLRTDDVAQARQQAAHENRATDYSSFGVWDNVAKKWELL